MKPSQHTINKWHDQVGEYVRQYGPVVRGRGVVQFHHPKGRTYKHRKTLIGCWWVIPLPWEFHDVASNSELNVTHYRKRFSEVYGKQSDLWIDMIERMRRDGITLPFGQEVIDAIEDTNY